MRKEKKRMNVSVTYEKKKRPQVSSHQIIRNRQKTESLRMISNKRMLRYRSPVLGESILSNSVVEKKEKVSFLEKLKTFILSPEETKESIDIEQIDQEEVVYKKRKEEISKIIKKEKQKLKYQKKIRLIKENEEILTRNISSKMLMMLPLVGISALFVSILPFGSELFKSAFIAIIFIVYGVIKLKIDNFSMKKRKQIRKIEGKYGLNNKEIKIDKEKINCYLRELADLTDEEVNEIPKKIIDAILNEKNKNNSNSENVRQNIEKNRIMMDNY